MRGSIVVVMVLVVACGGGRRTGPEAHATVASGALTSREVDEVVFEDSLEILACYQRANASDASLAGRVVVDFTIDEGGAVVSASVVAERTTLADPDVHACVLGKVQALVFPAKGGAVVRYPFEFVSSAP